MRIRNTKYPSYEVDEDKLKFQLKLKGLFGWGDRKVGGWKMVRE